MIIQKKCVCGKRFKIAEYRVKDGRGKFCCKRCYYDHAHHPSGLKYKLVKVNPTSFKKGQIPFNKGREHMMDEKHPQWKGDDVGYSALHTWIYRTWKKKEVCEFCGEDKKLDWANKNGIYNRNKINWLNLCRKCHLRYDRENPKRPVV
jgi:hypothetical protein